MLVTCALALVVAGAALAGNGGVAPPDPQSPNAGRIRDSYWLILGFAGAILVLVEGLLLAFVFRFRGRGRARHAEGPQLHGSTRLELMWTAFPVVVLAVIATFVFYKLPGIQDVPRASAAAENLKIRIDAHQFYWQFTYPDDVVSIDELRVPVGRVVEIDIHSQDVDHSWWIPELHGKFDAIPGEVNHTWFKAEKQGRFRGQCGEFCGLYHALMNARVVATAPAEFDRWLSSRTAETLGRDEYVGACSKCHDLKGEGGYGPAIAGNPILKNRESLEDLITKGQGKMPPVAKGWSDEQIDALLGYTSKRLSGGAAGGGAGGNAG